MASEWQALRASYAAPHPPVKKRARNGLAARRLHIIHKHHAVSTPATPLPTVL